MSKFLKNSAHVPLKPEGSKEIQEETGEFVEELLEPGDMLRKLRAQKGLSPNELGEQIGVNAETVSKMEDGEVPIDEKMAQKLGKFFKVDAQAFFS